MTLGLVAMTPVSGSPIATYYASPGIGTWLYPFYLLESNFPANGAQNVTVAVTGGTGLQGYAATSLFIQNVTQGAPLVNSNVGQTTTLRVPSGSGTFNVNAGGIGIAAIYDAYPDTITGTNSNGWTEASNFAGYSGNSQAATASQAYGAGGTSFVSFSLANGSWAQSGVTLYWDQGAAGAGVVPFNRERMSGGMQGLSGGMRAHYERREGSRLYTRA